VGAIALRDAVALALLHSPDLAAFAWETRAREARVLQAGKLPNPIVSVLLEDLGASRIEGIDASSAPVQPQTTIQLSQLVELGGKRAARRELAALDRDLAAWDYETARIDVFTQVTRAFFDVLAAQETVALTERTMQAVGEVRQSVGARVAAGAVSPIEETRAEISLAAVRVESEQARSLLGAARGRLASTWGSSEAVFLSALGDLGEVPSLPTREDLLARLADNPYLARWAAEISQRQAALAFERSKGVPDLEVIAGYRRFTDLGSNALVIGGSISLPIFDRNQGGIEEARTRLSKAYEQRRAAEARVAAALAEAYGALTSAHTAVTSLQAAVLPGAQQTFEAINEGYRLGKFGYLDVLDAQRTFIGASGQYLRALADYHKAAVEVERLIGAPLNAVRSQRAAIEEKE
jgi:cobalt-zinc-cadmium efflux system outer membrane protein